MVLFCNKLLKKNEEINLLYRSSTGYCGLPQMRVGSETSMTVHYNKTILNQLAGQITIIPMLITKPN
jgi:hypothetical protein